MIKILAILLFVIIPLNASAQEDKKEKMCVELYSCSIEAILKLDDKISPANIIADAVPSICIKETNSCIDELIESTKIDAIKQDPRMASDIEEVIYSAEWREKQRQSVKELIVPLVLKIRASNIKDAE